MNDDYNSPLGAFGSLINALGGGGDSGNMFPASDADDLNKGASFIPGEVTMARRRGEEVRFNKPCDNKCCWYWELPDGTHIYHWDRDYYESIARKNDVPAEGDVGACPQCGNTHTSGGTITP